MDEAVKPSATPQTPPASQEQQLQQFSYGKKWILTLVGVLIIAAVMGGAYGQNNPSLRGGSKATDVAISPTPSPAATDETANWKTYVHPNNYYQVSYPSTWTFIGKTGGGGPVFTPVPESDMFTSSWLIIGWPSGNQETLEERATKALSKGRSLLKREQIFIDNHEAIKQTIKDDNGFAIEIYVANVKDSDGVNGTLPIFIHNREGVFPSKYQSMFDQILSTFRFD